MVILNIVFLNVGVNGIVVASNWYFDLKGYCEKGKKTTKAETDDWLEHK